MSASWLYEAFKTHSTEEYMELLRAYANPTHEETMREIQERADERA